MKYLLAPLAPLLFAACGAAPAGETSAAPSPPRATAPPPSTPPRFVFSPEEIEPDAAIDDALADTFEGWARSRIFYGDLEAVPPMRFDAEGERCYAAALVVEEGGRLGPGGRARVPVLEMRVRARESKQTRVSQRVLYLEDALCVAHGSRVEVLFVEEVDGAARRAFEAGRGTFKLYLYERPSG